MYTDISMLPVLLAVRVYMQAWSAGRDFHVEKGGKGALRVEKARCALKTRSSAHGTDNDLDHLRTSYKCLPS